MKTRLHRLDDEQLAGLVGRGDSAAFETLYDRHHAPLLAFCRHMVGSREDGEDVLQQAFLRAHKALCDGRVPDRVRPWLFAIARNRCLTLIAARRDAAIPVEDVEPSFDGLAEDVQRRADLRELVTDLGRLPEDQRGALVLAELGDFSHPEIARVIGCSPAKVKALVFQARTSLDRGPRRAAHAVRRDPDAARDRARRPAASRLAAPPPEPVRSLRRLPAGRRGPPDRPRAHHAGRADRRPQGGGAGRRRRARRRRGRDRRGCRDRRRHRRHRRRRGRRAPRRAAAREPRRAAPASPAGAATAGGVAVKALAVKAAVAVAIGAGAAGGGVAVHDVVRDEPVRAATIERAAERLPAGRLAAPSRAAAPETLPADAGATVPAEDGARPGRRRARRIAAPPLAGGPVTVRRVRRLLQDGDPATTRRIRRRLRNADPVVRRRVAPADPARGRRARDRRDRRRRRARAPPAPPATHRPGSGDGAGDDVAPEATPAPTATPEPRRRRRRRPPPPVPVPAPAPAPTAEPAPEATPEATAEAAPTPAAEPEQDPLATPSPSPSP